MDDEKKADPPAECAKGEYDFLVGYTCTCGKKVGLGDQSIIQAAVANATIRVTHPECGGQMMLTPRRQVQFRATGPGGPNRHDRRALKRTSGGILVPR